MIKDSLIPFIVNVNNCMLTNENIRTEKEASSRLNIPAKNFQGVSDPGWGSPAKFFSKFLNTTENCCPPRPTLKKSLPLHS